MPSNDSPFAFWLTLNQYLIDISVKSQLISINALRVGQHLADYQPNIYQVSVKMSIKCPLSVFYYDYFILSSVCILPLVCSLHLTLSLHFTPGLQSAVCVLHWASWQDLYRFRPMTSSPPLRLNLIEFAPNQVEFAPNLVEFAPNQIEFAPNQVEFAPNHIGKKL